MKMVFLTLMIVASQAFATPEFKGEFPKGPDASLTPGALCERPDARRYPEQIAYCNRDVDPSLKADVFQEYRNIGWGLNPKDRGSYKIDHLIPLCMGGSNDEKNLWPQHKSIYGQTDLIEAVGCDKLSKGKIKQADVVKMVLDAKHDLSLAPKTLRYLQSL